jgi:DNA replication and repair protein RecF
VHLNRLVLTDFRSYRETDIAFAPGVTIFTGPNGAGKTNLVEAVGYAATLGSHRVATDAALVRSGAQRAIIRAALTAAGRDSLVEIEVNPSRANRVRLNRAPLPRPRAVLGTLTCVLFAPEDLAVVKGDPEQRRRYLDDLLVASRPRYAVIRSEYERVLRQRTALLKAARAAGRGLPAELPDWDEQLVGRGAELTAGRLRLTAALRPLVGAAYGQVCGTGGQVAIRYRVRAGADAQADPEPDQDGLARAMRQALERVRRAELDRAVCLVGPHRDELELWIGDLPARGYASHGESWSLALALRLAAFELLREPGEDPVLLLDDVFAELDAGRRERLAGLAARAEQVLVTAAVAADVPETLAGARYAVADGVISHG